MMKKRQFGLAGIDVASGVSVETGEGFCHIRAVSPDAEVVLEGQLTPDELRTMAVQWMQAAEAAELDALVVAELIEGMECEPGHAAAFLGALRKRRDDADRGSSNHGPSES